MAAVEFLVPIRLLAASSDPAGGTAGDLYLNTALKRLKVYTGTEWIVLPKITYGTTGSEPSSPTAGDIHVITA